MEDQKQRMRAEKEQFFSTIEDFGYCDNAILRTVVHRTSLDERVCIGIYGRFKPELRPCTPSTIFESKSITMEEQVLDLQTVRSSVETLIETGLANTEFGDVRFGGSKTKSVSLRFDGRAGYLTDWGEQFGSVRLVGYADVEEKDLYDAEEIKAELLSGCEPYDDLFDLILDKTDERGRSDVQPPSIIIRAPRYLKLNGYFEGDELVASLEAHRKTDLSKFRLGVIARSEAEHPALKRVALSLTNPRPHKGELVKITHRLVLSKDAKSSNLYLLQKKENRFTLIDSEILYKYAKTMRAIVHQHLDPNMETLESWVRGGGKDKSSDFEWGISLLLSLLGLCTEWVGDPLENLLTSKAKRPFGIDVIASTPDERTIILGQCTTTSLSDTKGSQLKLTANEIARILGTDAPHIVPVIFTNLDEDDMEVFVKKMKEEDIAVVGKKGIESLLGLARRGTSLQNVVNVILKTSHTIEGVM